jgi:hypothetical protein
MDALAFDWLGIGKKEEKHKKIGKRERRKFGIIFLPDSQPSP